MADYKSEHEGTRIDEAVSVALREATLTQAGHMSPSHVQQIIEIVNRLNQTQPILVSGKNIATINGQNLLAGGNISIESGTVSQDDILNIVCDEPITKLQIIETAWNVYNKIGQEVYYPNADARISGNNISIEKGWKLKYTGQWKWIPLEGKKVPTRTDGSWGVVLPSAGVPSAPLVKEVIISNTTIRQNIYAPKGGVVVQGDKLVRPAAGEGEDSAFVQATATFLDRYYYGVTEAAKPDGADVTSLANKDLTTTRARKVQHVTIVGNQRFCYAYPYSLGALTSAIVGGLDFLSDFDKQDNVIVTNAAGEQIRYFVYTFKNLGAFNDSTIDFK